MTVVANENNELIQMRLVTSWGVCIDYRKLNDTTRKDHFPLPFMDQMLKRLAGYEFYCFLDGFSGYFQIPIDPQDQEKTTFTCPYGTFTKGIVLGHKILKSGIEVDRAKVDVIAKLPSVDYLSKWVEAKALPTNDARVVVKFLKSLFSQFGIPRAIISDRGTHFCNDQFTRVMIKYEVTHRLTTAYHPQTSGQVETTGDHRKLQLNELSELRDQAYENSVIYKERTKKLHDSKIKNRIFNIGDQVLLFNSLLKIFSRKLKTRWSGPFTITRVFPYGTIELSQPNGLNFKVNGHRVKHYFGGDIPSSVAPDLRTFQMDN
nr:reverse transcriptase domain-containing protein [Tanacetum cinerariifolium]